MQLIPVIDIKDGIAVHAKLGQRAQYQAIHSALCSSCQLEAVIDAFLTLSDFKLFYLADLNAIMQQGDNGILIKNLLLNYPQITFWVDSGYQQRPSNLMSLSNYQAVLGSECYSTNQLQYLKAFDKNFVLSLDFSSENKPLGSLELFENQAFWTAKIIIMTLGRVGSYAGVDLEKLEYYQNLNPDVEFIASGGIRHINDVKQLQSIGIKKALCASALHNQAISFDELKNL